MKLPSSTLFVASAFAIANLHAAPEGDDNASAPAAEAPKTAQQTTERTAKEAATETGWLGVASSPVDALLATQLDMPEGVGVAVRLVLPESPAAKAGIEKYDVLFEFDGEPIRSPRHLGELVRSKAAGDSVEFSLVQRGSKKNTPVIIGARPEHLPEVPQEHLPMPGQVDMGDLPFKIMPLADDGEPDAEAVKQLEDLRQRLQQQFKGMLKLEGRNNLPGKGEIVGNSSRTMTFSGTDGVIQIRSKGGVTDVTVKDTEGIIVFEGSANSEEDRAKLPEAALEKLKLFGSSAADLNFGGFIFPALQMRVPKLKPAKKIVPGAKPATGEHATEEAKEIDTVPSAKKDGKKVAT